jgi:hypothetical protein
MDSPRWFDCGSVGNIRADKLAQLQLVCNHPTKSRVKLFWLHPDGHIVQARHPASAALQQSLEHADMMNMSNGCWVRESFIKSFSCFRTRNGHTTIEVFLFTGKLGRIVVHAQLGDRLRCRADIYDTWYDLGDVGCVSSTKLDTLQLVRASPSNLTITLYWKEIDALLKTRWTNSPQFQQELARYLTNEDGVCWRPGSAFHSWMRKSFMECIVATSVTPRGKTRLEVVLDGRTLHINVNDQHTKELLQCLDSSRLPADCQGVVTTKSKPDAVLICDGSVKVVPSHCLKVPPDWLVWQAADSTWSLSPQFLQQVITLEQKNEEQSVVLHLRDDVELKIPVPLKGDDTCHFMGDVAPDPFVLGVPRSLIKCAHFRDGISCKKVVVFLEDGHDDLLRSMKIRDRHLRRKAVDILLHCDLFRSVLTPTHLLFLRHGQFEDIGSTYNIKGQSQKRDAVRFTLKMGVSLAMRSLHEVDQLLNVIISGLRPTTAQIDMFFR